MIALYIFDNPLVKGVVPLYLMMLHLKLIVRSTSDQGVPQQGVIPNIGSSSLKITERADRVAGYADQRRAQSLNTWVASANRAVFRGT